MKKTVFIKNAIILTVASLVLRLFGIVFKVWVAAVIGSEGIGLYQLIFSFYMLAATFATAGICTGVTRLVSENLALGREKAARRVLLRGIELTLLAAVITVLLVGCGAKWIAGTVIGDMRALPALKILPLALPFMGVSSCIRGYFIAVRRALPHALTQILEQAVRIIAVILLIRAFASKGLAVCCAAVMAGDVLAESVCCLVLWLLYRHERKKHPPAASHADPGQGIVRKILHIALPISGGRYLNTALRTGENLLVPKFLAKNPLSGSQALSQFGMIKGMALPLLFFPSTLLNAVSTLLLPEISEAAALKGKHLIKAAAEKTLKITGLISCIVGGLFYTCGGRIGEAVYHSREIGILLTVLSPIVPFMYLDSISDGLLKGLDQQAFCFRTSVADSVLRNILVIALLPVTGLKGFIGIMYFSNVLTGVLNVGRLIKVSGARFSVIREGIFPPVCALGVTLLVKRGMDSLGIGNHLLYIGLSAVAASVAYLFLLLLAGSVSGEELLHNFKR